MTSKRTLSALVVAILCAASALFGVSKAYAADLTDQVTGLAATDASITDASGASYTPDSATSLFTAYQVTYNWAIPDGVAVSDGDTATFEIPQNLAVNKQVIFLVQDKTTGQTVGEAVIPEGSQTGTITFNEFFSSYSVNRAGTIGFSAYGTTNPIGDDNWNVAKVGTVNKEAGLASWIIPVNPKNETWTDVILHDVSSDNQTIDWSTFKVRTGQFDDTGNLPDDPAPVELVEGTDYTLTKNADGGFTINLAEITQGIQISYLAVPDDMEQGVLNNCVDLSHAGGTDAGTGNSCASIDLGGQGTGSGDSPEPTASATPTPSASESTPAQSASATPTPAPGVAVDTGGASDGSGAGLWAGIGVIAVGAAAATTVVVRRRHRTAV